MTEWFRSWHGAPTDPKWVLIARKAGVPPAVASAIAWALFDHASQANPRGSVADFDCEVYAAWGGLDDAAVRKAVEAMTDRGMIGRDGILTKWAKRQPEREDGSAERARAWRERNKASPNAEPEAKPQENNQERNRTQSNADEQAATKPNATEPHREDTDTDTDTDTDSEKEEKERNARETRAYFARQLNAGFDRFWEAWPNKVGKPAALRAFAPVAPQLDAILLGIAAYVRDKPADRAWLNPATFLNQRRWEDRPAAVGPPARASPASPPKTDALSTLYRIAHGDDKSTDNLFGGSSAPCADVRIIEGFALPDVQRDRSARDTPGDRG